MALTLISNYPASGATDIPLQTNIVAEFSEAVASGSVNVNSFVVYSAGYTVYRDTAGLPFDTTLRPGYADMDYVEGTFSISGATVTFTPKQPLQPEKQYFVLLGGYDINTTANKYIKASGTINKLMKSVKWSFRTGILDLEEPPTSAEEIDYDSLIEQIVTSQGVTTSDVVVSPESGSYNVILVDSTLFTITFPTAVDVDSLDYTVYVVDQADPLKRSIELPVTYELEGTRIVKIKLA